MYTRIPSFLGFLPVSATTEHWVGFPVLSLVTCFVYVCVFSRSVVSDSLWPHELWPARLLWPWGFPGKNPGVGCHSSGSSGDLPHPGLNLCLLNWRETAPPGKPHIVVYTCQSQSPSPSHLHPYFGIRTSVVCICVSISTLQIGSSLPFSRFYMYSLTCDILCVSLSDLLRSVLQSLGLATSPQVWVLPFGMESHEHIFIKWLSATMESGRPPFYNRS